MAQCSMGLGGSSLFFRDGVRAIQNPVLSFTGHSGQCDMTSLSFQVDAHWQEIKWIKSYVQCVVGAKYDKKNLALPERAIHLSPQSLSYSNIQLVLVVECVCLCVCVFECV